MRRINPWVTALLLILVSCGLHGQPAFICGTTDVDEVKRQMIQNRQDMQNYVFDRNTITYIPVRFHLVARNHGSGRVSEYTPLKALCFLNTNFANQQVQFFLKEVKQFDNSLVYSNPMSHTGRATISKQMIYDAINVFIVGEMVDQTAAYYQPPAGKNGADWVVISSTFADDPRVLTHEIGHFFSLPHPFHGWESSGGWVPNIHGNPVGLMAPDGKTLNEFANGNNCKTAGDGFCDTPADYLFPSLDCKYSANAKDPLNELLKPDVQNFMNYHFSCKNYSFTAEQKMAISNSLFHPTRDYLKNSIAPKAAIVNSAPALISPSGNSLVPTYNKVELHWEAIVGADNYMIEVSNSAGTQRYISDKNSTTLTTLKPSTGYWWRVVGYNSFSTCGAYSLTRLFRTGDVLNNTSSQEKNWKWEVYPTALQIGNPIRLEINANEGFFAKVKLTALTGQTLVLFDKHQFQQGDSQIELPTSELVPGIYVLTIEGEKGLDSKRIALMK